MNVLIVDDHVTNRASLQSLLRDRGWTACEAVDGHDGLAVLKSGTGLVHAIISDILMPRMDGYRFCFEVRRLPRFREIPFIFYSSTHTSTSDEKLGLQLGANAFLHNPGDEQALIETLDGLQGPSSRLVTSRMELPQELTLMKEYSARLVLKLEEKNIELSLRTEQLQALSRRLLDVQESERRHLARELHDEIGQVLTVLKLNLEAMEPASTPVAPDEKVVNCIRWVDQLLRQVRGISLDLRPSILDDLGLIAALRWYLEQDVGRAGLRVRLDVPAVERRYDPGVETACFRVAQEAVTNIRRHAGARQATLSLSESAGVLRLRVSDDGAGFDVAAACRRAQGGGSFGLLGMQERVALVGGHLEFNSQPGQGTELRARFPLDPLQPGEDAARP